MAAEEKFRVVRDEAANRDNFQCTECEAWWSRPAMTADEILDELDRHVCGPSPLAGLSPLRVATLMIRAGAAADDERLHQLVQDASTAALAPRSQTLWWLAFVAERALSQADEAMQLPPGSVLEAIERLIPPDAWE